MAQPTLANYIKAYIGCAKVNTKRHLIKIFVRVKVLYKNVYIRSYLLDLKKKKKKNGKIEKYKKKCTKMQKIQNVD